MKLLNFFQKTIEYSFYLLFFLVPLAFTGDTSELFEFNKLWITFILTIVIGIAWISKMIIKRELRIQKTPLDIPIALFLISEVISTFISLDTHTSLWGYYSRFNGGLFSILAYVFLFYAFVSNLREDETKKEEAFSFKKVYIFIAGIVVFFIGALISSTIKAGDVTVIPFQMLSILTTALVSFGILMQAAPHGVIKRTLYAILSSALLVVLWGLPSHFGYDPTCLLFRGTFDVSCWTNDFQPKVRIFSTLGQPDWLAAYLATLLPIIAALFINLSTEAKITFNKKLTFLKNHNFIILSGLFVFFVLSYLAFLYSQSRSIIAAGWIVLPVLLAYYLWFYVRPKFDKKNITLNFRAAVLIFLTLGAVTFFAGQPFGQLNKFTLVGIQQHFAKPASVKPASSPQPAVKPATPAPTTELGGITDSGTIRQYVWQGAISIWKNNPIFGSGVETFAFAYYKYRPAAHNLTSEWQFLYNKAHNEYLNYLATTGIVGITTYLLMIGSFLFFSLKYLFAKRNKLSHNDFLAASIIAGYATILIGNFFGFSVVIINIFFYVLPALVFILAGLINYDKHYSMSFGKKESYELTTSRKISIAVIGFIGLYLIYTLVNFWTADRYYYFGYNYDHQVGNYQTAYTYLKIAVEKRPSEPVFKDEFAYNNAILGTEILAQNQKQQSAQAAQTAKQLIQSGIDATNQVTSEHPNNIVFWKTKVRIFYNISQVDPNYYSAALIAIKKSAELAPTDADVSYNLGVLYGQTGDPKDAVTTLQNTIKLKVDYGNAYYALAIFYHQLGVDQKGNIVNPTNAQKAIDEMHLYIDKFGPNQQAQDALNAWEKK
jgi:hypothetical protein